MLHQFLEIILYLRHQVLEALLSPCAVFLSFHNLSVSAFLGGLINEFLVICFPCKNADLMSKQFFFYPLEARITNSSLMLSLPHVGKSFLSLSKSPSLKPQASRWALTLIPSLYVSVATQVVVKNLCTWFGTSS